MNKCNKAYHGTIKMKTVNLKSSTDIEFNKENYNEDPKFKAGDHVKIKN